MLKGKLGFKKILEDTSNFSLKGMVEPTFYNFGTDNVRVLHSVVKPGESFLAGASQVVMDSDVPIEFEGSNKAGRNLMCYFVTLETNC